MEGGRRQVVQFTAHKRRGGSSFASNPAPSKKPSTEPKADPKIDDVAEKVSIPSKVKEAPAASSKIPGDSTAESVNRGHYGNLAYRSYTAKDYKKTIEYAEKVCFVVPSSASHLKEMRDICSFCSTEKFHTYRQTITLTAEE